MQCVAPIRAWKPFSGGKLIFKEDDAGDAHEVHIPCGHCIECKLNYAQQWAIRCMHEGQMHDGNSFVTLTFSPEMLPQYGNLEYKYFQLFMRRLRRTLGPARFYMSGEYGSENWRPHFHAILFGIWFPDRKYYRTMESGFKLYTSEILDALWMKDGKSLGFASVGDLSLESAGYVARYVTKKITGDMAVAHYSRVDMSSGECFQLTPEFSRMSLKPGIGFTWYDRYGATDLVGDRVIYSGRRLRPPKYYDKLLADRDPDLYDSVINDRVLSGRKNSGESLPDRLRAREIVTRARIKSLKRSLE